MRHQKWGNAFFHFLLIYDKFPKFADECVTNFAIFSNRCREQEEKDRKAALIYQQIEEENFIDDIDEGPI